MLETKNGRSNVYGAEYSKCKHMMKLDFKGLIFIEIPKSCMKHDFNFML